MPKFKIEKNTSISAPEAFQKIQNFLADDSDLHKLDPGYKCEFNDSTLEGSANGKKFKAHLKVGSGGGGTNVVLTVDLPLMLTPFKGMVETLLTKKLTKLLG